MKYGWKAMRKTGFATFVLSVAPAALNGQEAALPSPRELVTRHIEAIGGAAAILEASSMHSTGEFSAPGMGISGELEMFQMQPNKVVSRVAVTGIGELRRGFDGGVGWSINPMEGPRLLHGPEMLQIQDEADRRAVLRDPALIESLNTIGQTEMNGVACYQVRVVWKSGRETTDCYALDSGLLVGSSLSLESPVGKVEATIFYSQYRDFGGIRLATVTIQRVLGQEQQFTIRNVEFGGVDPAVFELPAEIVALRDQRLLD